MSLRGRVERLEAHNRQRPCGDPFHSPLTIHPVDYRAGLADLAPADVGGERATVVPPARCPSCGEGAAGIPIRAIDTGSEDYWALQRKPAGLVEMPQIDYRVICEPLYSDEQEESAS